MNYQELTLPQIYAEAEAIAAEARTLFGHLDARQLNWKPNPEAWSVAQCLDHLITIDSAYYPTFERILKGDHRRGLLHRLPALPGLFGKMMIRSLSPDSSRKLKAPLAAQPSSSSIEPAIVQHFVAHQHEMLAKMRSLESMRPETLIITSPFISVIVYSLLDTFRLVVAHARRHLAQARRVTEANGFPR